MDAGNFENAEAMFSSKLGDEQVRVKIVGIGGAGTNAVDRLQLDHPANISLAAVNTDAQALEGSPLTEKLMIGRNLTRGLSAGGQVEIGRAAAEADIARLAKMVDGVDLLVVLAGMGGGTGTGAAPVVAKLAAEQGALVFAFVTMPFSMEGLVRHKQAEEGLVNLRSCCDAVIPLPNDVLLQHIDENATVLDAFAQADVWMSRGVQSICTMLFNTGLINLDFATLRKAFGNRGGRTLFGIGRGEGPEALHKAMSDLQYCPLLHLPELPRKADKLLVNIVGGVDMSMQDVNAILAEVTERFCSRQETFLGAVVDDNLRGVVEICVIGTTDVTGRNVYNDYLSKSKEREQVARVSRTSRQAKAVPLPQKTGESAAPEEKSQPARAVHQSKLRENGEGNQQPQEEFSFAGEEQNRGYFERTARNIIDGEDVDVPTFLRRGVKLRL